MTLAMDPVGGRAAPSMYTVKVTDLLSQSELRPHQEMLHDGLLNPHDEHSGISVIFVSHQWLGVGSPDLSGFLSVPMFLLSAPSAALASFCSLSGAFAVFVSFCRVRGLLLYS